MQEDKRRNRYLQWQERLNKTAWYKFIWSLFAIYTVGGVIVFFFVLLFSGYQNVAVVALASLFIARGVISPLVYLLYKKARPYQQYEFTTIFSKLLSTRSHIHNSFPSDHALSLAALSFVVLYFLPVVGWILLVLMLLNGYGRIVLGYHDWFDVIGGWIIGGLVAWGSIVFIAPMLFTRI